MHSTHGLVLALPGAFTPLSIVGLSVSMSALGSALALRNHHAVNDDEASTIVSLVGALVSRGGKVPR